MAKSERTRIDYLPGRVVKLAAADDAVNRPKRGRPKLRDDAYYRGVLESYFYMLDWYAKTNNGGSPESVPKLLSAFFADVFVRGGMRPSRVDNPQFMGKLKTFSNAISVAKTLRRTNPQNWHF